MPTSARQNALLELFGESVTSRRVDVGIAPTNRRAAACCLTSLALPRQCTI